MWGKFIFLLVVYKALVVWGGFEVVFLEGVLYVICVFILFGFCFEYF